MRNHQNPAAKPSTQPTQPRRKYAAPAPLTSRASRSEGAGPGPTRKHPRDK